MLPLLYLCIYILAYRVFSGSLKYSSLWMVGNLLASGYQKERENLKTTMLSTDLSASESRGSQYSL